MISDFYILVFPFFIPLFINFFYICPYFLFLQTDNMVEPVPESINFPNEEEKVLKFWQDKDCFQECLKQSKNRPR